MGDPFRKEEQMCVELFFSCLLAIQGVAWGRFLSGNQEATFCNPKFIQSEFCNNFSLLLLRTAMLCCAVW